MQIIFIAPNQMLRTELKAKPRSLSLETPQDPGLQLLQSPTEQLPHMRSPCIVQGNRGIRLYGTSPQVQSMCLPPRRRSLHYQASALFSGASRDEFEEFEDDPGNTLELVREARLAETRVNRVYDNRVKVIGGGRIDDSTQLSNNVQLQ